MTPDKWADLLPVCMLTKHQNHCHIFSTWGRARCCQEAVRKKRDFQIQTQGLGRNQVMKASRRPTENSIRLHSAHHCWVVFVSATTSDGSCRNLQTQSWKLKNGSMWAHGVWTWKPGFETLLLTFGSRKVSKFTQPSSLDLRTCWRENHGPYPLGAGGFTKKAHVKAWFTLSVSDAPLAPQQHLQRLQTSSSLSNSCTIFSSRSA